MPQLNLAFTNLAPRPLKNMVFTLSIQDQAGNQQSYRDDLTYQKTPVQPKEHRIYSWNLDPSLVDMHHTGESLTLTTVQYIDGATWKDDGSLACALSVDFRAK